MRIGYIDTIKGGLIALLFFFILSIIIPYSTNAVGEAEIIFTVSTFLFAIMVGFFISRFNNRYDAVRELVGSEDAYWLSIYNMSTFYDDDFVSKMTEVIDGYYITSYDYDLGNYYKHNAKYLREAYQILKNAKIKSNFLAEQIVDDIVGTLNSIEEVRNKSTVITNERLSLGSWLVLLVLAFIIIVSSFFLRVDSMYSNMTTIMFSTAMIMIFFLLRDLQKYRLGGEALLEESGEEVFEFIGKPRYYNKMYLDEGTVKIPKNIKEYRLGHHKPGEELNIELIKL